MSTQAQSRRTLAAVSRSPTIDSGGRMRRALLLAVGVPCIGIWACSSSTAPPPPIATVSGTITSNHGGGIGAATVVVTPTGGSALPAVQTTAGGSYSVLAVPNGSGSVAVSGLPGDCTVPSPVGYAIANATATANVAVTCSAPENVTVWVFGDSTIRGFTATQLASSASATPAVVLNTIFGISGAFDANGNLWVAEFSNAVVEYTASQLAATGSPTPNVTLAATVAGSLNEPQVLAFDANGNLWVANSNSSGPGANTLVEFTAGQLTASGSPTPAVTLSADSHSINDPQGLAFDQSGNLWIANFQSNTVVALLPSQLGTSGSPVPAITLSGSLSGPGTLAFDGAGNLWVPNASNNTVVEFASGQLGATGSPTPAVTLTSTGSQELNVPTAVAFDAHGNLWVTGANPHQALNSSTPTGAVFEFATSQIMASGALVPTVTITDLVPSFWTALVFTPK